MGTDPQTQGPVVSTAHRGNALVTWANSLALVSLGALAYLSMQEPERDPKLQGIAEKTRKLQSGAAWLELRSGNPMEAAQAARELLPLAQEVAGELADLAKFSFTNSPPGLTPRAE